MLDNKIIFNFVFIINKNSVIYFLLFLTLIILSYFYDYKEQERGRRVWLYITIIFLILLGTLHYRVGFDSVAYERFYNNLTPLNYIKLKEIESYRYAPGFVVLASLTKIVSPDLILLNLIQSSFICGIVAWFIIKNTKKIFFALLMFYVFLFTLLVFEQIREAISVGFFLLAWPAFKKRNWIIWYLLSFCALLFHTSAYIMLGLPLILLPGIKQFFLFGKRTFLFSIIILSLAFFLRITFSKYIELLAVTDSMEELTAKYADTTYVKGNLNIVGLIAMIIKTVLYPFLALIYFYKIRYTRHSHLQDLEMFTLISIYISLLSLGVPIIGRLNNYFLIFAIIIISDWIFNYIPLKGKKIRLGFSTWAIILLPLFAIQIYTAYFPNLNKSGTYKNYMAYYPFTTYLDKQKDATKEKVLNYARRKK